MSLTLTDTTRRPPSPGAPKSPTLLIWSADVGEGNETPRNAAPSPSIGELLREGEQRPAQADWLKEPHGYLLKPDFQRSEQQRRIHNATADSPRCEEDEVVGRRPHLISSLSRGLTNRHFHRRYFRLVKGSDLSFYKTMTDRRRLGFVDLSLIEYVQLSRIKDAPTHSIDLVSRHRIYTLGADTRHDLAEWCVAICHAMRRIASGRAALSDAPLWRQFDDVYSDPAASVTLKLKRVVATTSRDDGEHSPSTERAISPQSLSSPTLSSPEKLRERKTELFRSRSDESVADDEDGKEEKREETWFAVVTRIEGPARGLVKRSDIVVGVNDTSFAGMSYDEAMMALRSASFPLTLRCARDVGSRVVMEGWCLVDQRLRYLELSRSSLTGTRPAAGGAVAGCIDFGYDLGIVTGIENEENVVALELSNDPKDIVHFEFPTVEQARRWYFALTPLVNRTYNSLRIRNNSERRRRNLSPLCTSPRLFSPLFRRKHSSDDDLVESAALLTEIGSRVRMSMDSLQNREESIFSLSKTQTKLSDLAPSSSGKTTTRFRATVHEQDSSRRVSIVLSQQHKKSLWIFSPDATGDDVAIAQVDLFDDSAISIRTPDFSVLRVALNNDTRRFLVYVDEDDSFRRTLYATLVADTAGRSFPFTPDHECCAYGRECKPLGELKFRVVACDPLEEDDFATPWTLCSACIQHPRFLKLYSTQGRQLLEKKKIVSSRIVAETPHRFDVFVGEPRIFYRFEARSAADAKLLNRFFV